jgi:biotin carboxylase
VDVGQRFGILCTSPQWTAAARTAAALTRRGAEVCLIAPPDSIVARTRFKTADILMPGDRMSRSMPALMRTLAEEFGAHSVLAGDDMAFAGLAALVKRMESLDLSAATRALLQRSMPDAEAAQLIACDSRFIAAQRDRPCPAPPLVVNPSPDEAVQFAAAVGFPVMVKRDGGASGAGVSLCVDEAQLRTALANVPADPRQAGCVVQKFVTGAVYGVTVSGVKGRALAAFSFAKHRTASRFGPTSVARLDMRQDIIAQSCALFESYGLNGYAGFDYMVDEAGRAFFIEINPRIMPTGHFSDCFGVDLTAAFLAGVSGEPAPAQSPPTHEFVALFPSEWMRDADSPYLRTAWHDVPWDDPAVLAAMIDRAVIVESRRTAAGFAAF